MRTLRIFALLSLLLATSLFWAQTGTSTIRGTITDQSGGVIPGAKVTLTNTETNATRDTQSNETGTYVFDLITPATYKVAVEATGFKQKVVANVAALIGKPTTTNIELEVGTVNQVVEVNSTELNRLMSALLEAELNINYLYSFIPHPEGKSIIGLSMEDNETAEQALRRHQFRTLRQVDISR